MTGEALFPGPHFSRVNGDLHLGGVKLSDLAEKYGTPLYVYDFDRIRSRARHLANELHAVNERSRAFFAVKALSNLSALKALHSEGLGMDVVSGGEIERCLATGINARDIVFSGVAKSRDEISLGVRVGIGCFNIESPHEVDLLIASLGLAGKKAHVALRINPDVDGKTHEKINTGLAETKFGLNPTLAMTVARKILQHPCLILSGVSSHIGSQIFDLQTFRDAGHEVREFAKNLLELGAPIDHIDMGGGLGVAHRPGELDNAPTFKAWVDAVKTSLPNRDTALHLEPGRSIVADSGVLLTRVIEVKSGDSKKFALVDAGMTELLRPALYDAYHRIEHVARETTDNDERYDVVGPVCETSCWLGEDEALPGVSSGDVLAILTSGAYGMTMASNYNTRVKPAELAIEQSSVRLIRKQETLSSLWELERF